MKLFRKKERYVILTDDRKTRDKIEIFVMGLAVDGVDIDPLGKIYAISFIPDFEKSTVNLALMAGFKNGYKINFGEHVTMLMKES